MALHQKYAKGKRKLRAVTYLIKTLKIITNVRIFSLHPVYSLGLHVTPRVRWVPWSIMWRSSAIILRIGSMRLGWFSSHDYRSTLSNLKVLRRKKLASTDKMPYSCQHQVNKWISKLDNVTRQLQEPVKENYIFLDLSQNKDEKRKQHSNEINEPTGSSFSQKDSECSE